MIIFKFFETTSYILYKIKISNLLESINTKEDLLYFCFKDFQNVTAKVLKRKGYNIKFTNKCGEEGNGLILNNIQYAEVWKHSLNHIVDVEAAMKLAKCMQSNSIYRGMLITLGDFKQNTIMFSHKNVIECINGEQLLEMCKEVQKRKEVKVNVPGT
ncbi:MAG: restriction endonuclease [bacterium]|nr:restriction endonuclease [bacterium]